MNFDNNSFYNNLINTDSGKSSNHHKGYKSGSNTLIIAVLAIIALLAPVICVICIISDGLFQTYQKYGILLGITLLEIEFFGISLMKWGIEKRNGKNNQHRNGFFAEHEGIGIFILLVIAIASIGILISDINNFFFPLLLGNGIYFVFR